MSKEKNIQIPYSLFISTMNFLESLDPQLFNGDISGLYQRVLYGFSKKKSAILLHNNYGRVFAFEDTYARKVILDTYVSKKKKHNETFNN